MSFDPASVVAEVIKEVGIYALKSLLTLNAGAVIVLLTFVGNIEDSKTVVFDIDRLKFGMFLFLAGLTLAFIAIATTYASAQRTLLPDNSNNEPFGWFIVKMIGPSALSFVCFLIGVGIAISGISVP